MKTENRYRFHDRSEITTADTMSGRSKICNAAFRSPRIRTAILELTEVLLPYVGLLCHLSGNSRTTPLGWFRLLSRRVRNLVT